MNIKDILYLCTFNIFVILSVIITLKLEAGIQHGQGAEVQSPKNEDLGFFVDC